MKDLRELIDWVKKADRNTLEVWNDATKEPVEKELNRSKAEEESGSVENWFADLAERGITNISITSRKKNGTGWLERSAPHFVRIGSTGKQENPGNGSQVNSHTPAATGLPGLMGAPGLSFPQMLDLSTKAALLSKAERDLETEKQKNKELEEKYENLKNERDEEVTQQNRLKSYAELATGLGPMLMGFFPKLANPETGLNAPDDTEGLSDLKKALIRLLKSERVDETMTGAAYTVISFALNGNQQFVSEFTQLINKHQPTQE